MQSSQMAVTCSLLLALTACASRFPAHYKQSGLRDVSIDYCENLEAGSWKDARYLDRYSCVAKYGQPADLSAALDFECDLREQLDRQASFVREPDEEYPVVWVAPIYPYLAIDKEVKGHVLLRFDIDDQGAPTNIRIVESVPAGVFDGFVRFAVSKWKYCERGESDHEFRFTFITTR